MANSETQKSADKECLKAMQEIVESLTEHKLSSTTKMDNLQHNIIQLEDKLKGYDNHLIENESLKRQLKRISNENEEVLGDVSILEKNNNKLQEEINLLTMQNKKLIDDSTELQRQLSESQDDIISDEQDKELKSKNEKLLIDLTNLGQTNTDLKSQIYTLSSKNETLESDISNLQKQIDYISSANEESQIELIKKEELCSNLSSLDERYKSLENKNNELSSMYEELQTEVKSLKQENESLKDNQNEATNTEELVLKNETLLTELSQYKINYEKQSAELAQLQEHIVSVKSEKLETFETKKDEEIEKMRKKMNLYKTKLFEIASKLRQLKTNREILLETIREYATTIPKWQSEIAHMSNELFTNLLRLEQENKKLHIQQDESSNMLKQCRAENGELLSELKEINNVIKDRGEVISLQLSKINELQQNLNAKDKQLSEISEELSMTRERELQSETLSTSTISRADESLRMREIDDSFEEKYNKLRSLAVKLKKKVAEQQTQLQKYETDDNKMSSKNIRTLQEDNDKLQDELELLRKSNSTNQLNTKELNTKIGELETNITNLESAKVGKSGSDNAIREYQTQISNLKKEKETSNQAIKEIENENNQLKITLKNKEKELTDEMETQKHLRSEIDKLKLAVKKTNVLSLEMEAYEKSLTDINNKLEIKRTQCAELEQTIEAQNDTVNSLKNQIKFLDSELNAEKLHSKEVKSQIDLEQNKLRESEHDNSQLNQQLKDMKKDYDQMKVDMNEARFELANSISDKEKVCGILEIEKIKLTKQVYELEDNVKTLSNSVKEKEKQIDDLTTEFTSYKVRAQSVLRQNQSKDTSREKEMEDEISVLQAQATAREVKINQITKQYEERDALLSELKADKLRFQNRCKELLDLLDELRLQNEASIEEHRKLNIEYNESLKSQKLQNDTLNNCYKKQIEDIEEKCQKEIENLNTKLKFFSLHKSEESSTVERSHISTSEEQKINLLLMEREECEGSESASQSSQVHQVHLPRRKLSSTSKSRRDLIPLDELLNSSFDEGNTVMNENLRSISPTIELQQTKEKLNTQENRAKHLTALLAETEQDLVKLTQLNEVLKEEVRRQQRSIEREEHVNNSEYLKNVIFKVRTI